MQAQSKLLWQNEAVNFPQAINAHAWLSGSPENKSGTGSGEGGDSSIYTGGVSATTFPDASAVGGVWKRIPMANWDFLRIFGEFMATDIDGATSTDVYLRAFAFWEPPGAMPAIREASLPLGNDMVLANANIFMPQRCQVLAWNYSGTSNLNDVIARSTDWSSGGSTLLRGGLNQEYPLVHPTAPANNRVRSWFLDVGTGQMTDTTNIHQKQTKVGEPLVHAGGVGTIWVAVKFLNNAAWAGATQPVIAGRLVATKMRHGSGSA